MVKVPFIIDASSIINLFNANALDLACEIHADPLLVTPLVVGECSVPCAGQILGLQSMGKVKLVQDDQIPADLFLDLLKKYKLGDGETEVIALSIALGLPVCCDDKRARNLAKEILGRERVTGSLGFLRKSVEVNLIQCTTAFHFFLKMRNAGGFLPSLEKTFFCEGLDTC